MTHTDDDGGELAPSYDSTVEQPQVFTLHWEGPPRVTEPVEPELGDGAEATPEQDPQAIARGEQGRAIWQQIEREAERKGDRALWQRKLHAYGWVKLHARGNARDYAERHEVNHATVRTWIADVARLAYEVGFRLHEDRLLLVGEAQPGLKALRERVNRDAGSEESRQALEQAAPVFRGEDPYFHLNEGHVLRARGRLEASDDTLRDGLTIAEARPIRALLWNARGQTFWDCGPGSTWPLSDFLDRAERAFRRAAALDPGQYFPFVNLAQLAVDAGDLRRAEYWLGELSTARKRMDDSMRIDLAKYLEQAEWGGAVESTRFWRSGPAKWIRAAARRGALCAVLLLGLLGAGNAVAGGAPDEGTIAALEAPAGSDCGRRGGAGGN